MEADSTSVPSASAPTRVSGREREGGGGGGGGGEWKGEGGAL